MVLSDNNNDSDFLYKLIIPHVSSNVSENWQYHKIEFRRYNKASQPGSEVVCLMCFHEKQTTASNKNYVQHGSMRSLIMSQGGLRDDQ